MQSSDAEQPDNAEKSAPSGTVRVASSRELLGPGGLLRIEHNGEIYTLRLTRNDRLILTK